MNRRELVVGEAEGGLRLDKAIAALCPDLSRNAARALISAGGVFLAGKRVRVASRQVRPGQVVQITLSEGGRLAPKQTRPIDPRRVLHVDPHLIAVDKPAGVPAQATLTSDRDTLPAQVGAHLNAPVGLVHRLDRGTSGVTIFGRRTKATRALAEAFREGQARKLYLALCQGTLPAETGRFEGRLAPRPGRAGGFECVESGGIYAATTYRHLGVLGETGQGAPLCAVALWPETGRTHQLRVHLSTLGAPLLGDRRYGGPDHLTLRDGRRLELGRALLHARALGLPHPCAAPDLELCAPLPPDFLDLVEALGAPASLLEGPTLAGLPLAP